MSRKKKIADILAEIEYRIEASDLLSAEEKLAAMERAQEHVLKTRKEKAIDAYYAAAVKEAEREHVPADQYEDFFVDLPEYTHCIRVDINTAYYHGVTYQVSYKVARSLAENQAAAWAHDREIQGKRRHGDLLRQPLYTNLSPNNPQGRVTNTGNMRPPRI